MSESRVPFHPYAELFPRLSFAESAVLSGASGREGLLEAITLYEGKILDGRERYLGCLSKQVTPRFQEYAGECGSPLEFVVSKNVRRRHLTDGQRALVAAKLRSHFQEEARQRQLAALKRGNESPVGLNSGQREQPQESGLSPQEESEKSVGLNSGQREQPKEKRAFRLSKKVRNPSA